MNRNTFDSGFNTIADQFRNKGIASNNQRMAGDYLAEFTKDSGVQKILGNKDYRNGVNNSKDGGKNAPSNVMRTMGATSNKTTPSAAPAPAAKNTGTSPSAPTSDSSAWLNGVPSAAERTQMYYDSLTAEQQAKFDTKHYSLNAQKQRVGEAKSHRDNISSNFQNDEAEFTWAANYTGPKTFEEAGKIKATDGAGAIASYLGQINRYNNAMNKQKKLQEQYAKNKK